MPTLAEIRTEIENLRNKAPDSVRHKCLKRLHNYTKTDTVLYASGWMSTKKYQKIPGQLFSLTPEDVQSFMAALHGLKGEKLDLIIHSPGGSLEGTDQIVQYLRMKYKYIRGFIPHNAMSAATMLSCACDEIVMGKQSALGPIDPQITFNTPNGAASSPAQSILDELKMAKADISKDPKLSTLWTPRINGYPPGIYETCTTTIANSKSKVREWMTKYMFAKKEGGDELAQTISDWLGDATEHKTHGRPLGYEVCRDKGLNVKLLEDDNTLQDLILSVYHAATVTFELTQCVKFTENHSGKGHYLQVKVNS